MPTRIEREVDASTYGALVPVAKILGRRTLAVVQSLAESDAVILRKPRRHENPRSLADYQRLTPWRPLHPTQVDELKSLLLDPRWYWTGRPRYRRFPPLTGFAFRIRGPVGEVVILADLQNPGWEWTCGAERYWGFHFAGRRVAALAKSLFPEHASPSRTAVWKKGVIEALERDKQSD